MIKDFIKETRKENFLELVPGEDFYTSMREIEDSCKKSEASQEDIPDAILASVSIIELNNSIDKSIKEQTNLGYIESFAVINNVKTNDEGIVLNNQGEEFKYNSPSSISLKIQKDSSKKDENVSLSPVAMFYSKMTRCLLNVLPGLPKNLSEEFGHDFINIKNVVSKCRHLSSLLFGVNKLSSDWKNSKIILLTKQGEEKINNAYEKLKSSAESKEKASFECNIDIF